MNKYECSITNKIQQKQLLMINKLKKILDDNNIKFFLAFGSALGAVRHNGFIPWDDDIDIHILGEDYPKLQKIFMSSNTGDLELHDPFLCKDYPYCFPKIVSKSSFLKEKSLEHLKYSSGIYIDIFLIFDAGKNKLARKFNYYIRYINYGILRARFNKKNGLLHHFSKIFSIKRVQKRLYKFYKRPLKNKLCCEPSIFDKKTFYQSSWFQDVAYFKFEGLDMPLCKEFDSYLKWNYGEYMTLPKEEDRVSNHDIAELIIDGEKII